MFGKKGKEKVEIAKMTISEDGKIGIDGNFNRDLLINLLRKELMWQEELERLDVQEQVSRLKKED